MAEKGLKKWVITITVITAALLELIDTTIVNVSMPQIMGNLGATLEDVAWIVTGYAVANVIILPMSGWLGSRFGRKSHLPGGQVPETEPAVRSAAEVLRRRHERHLREPSAVGSCPSTWLILPSAS